MAKGPDFDGEAEEPPERPPSSAERQLEVADRASVDLTNQRKAVFLIGRGNTGKAILCHNVAKYSNPSGTATSLTSE